MKNKLIIISILFCALLLGRNAYAQPGTVDLSFNTGSGFDEEVYALAIQNDGKIIVGGLFTSFNGNTSNRIARLNTDGSFDASFVTGSGFNGNLYSVIIQPDGKIIAGGNFTSYNGISATRIIRLNTNGSVDNSFDAGTGFNQEVYALALQPDGKVIAGGLFSSINGINAYCVTRLNTEGGVDNLFDTGNGITGNNEAYVKTILIQDDGKIMLAGSFDYFDGIEENNHTRLNANGSWDNTYYICNGFNTRVNTLAIQPDDKLLVGGEFTQACFDTVSYTSRQLVTGETDTSFFDQNGFDAFVKCLALDQSGKILVGGSFLSYNGIVRPKIARLHYNGLLDFSFNPGDGFDNNINCIISQSDRKIIAAGSFTTYNGSVQNRIVRINGDNFTLTLEGMSQATCTIGEGYINVEATDGVPPYTYEWDTNPAQYSDSIGGLGTGVYSVTATDNSGETIVGSVLLQGPDITVDRDLAGHFITIPFRPGRESVINIYASNSGCEETNGIVKFVLDNQLTLVYANPTPVLITGDTLFWNFTNLNYYTNDFSAFIRVVTDTVAQIGDTICLSMLVLPSEEDADNHIDMCYPVINSYDPNIKSVSPQGFGSDGFISNNQTMYYYIQFQNTGNAEAIDIHIIDSLDTDLNLQSLKIISSSHPMELDIIYNRVLDFRFNNINLPDSNSNEPASHGYVIYEIEQNANLPVWTEITNTANIYFDFNPPIVTNTTLNTIRSSTGIEDMTSYPLTIYPNPATTQLTITGYTPAYLKLCNTLGQTVAEENNTNKLLLGTLPQGLYVLQLFDAKGGLVKAEKVVKE